MTPIRRWLATLLLVVALGGPLEARAQMRCAASGSGVDLAILGAQPIEREEGWVLLFTVMNTGAAQSTSFRVVLVSDGLASESVYENLRGLKPGKTLRWELEVPKELAPPAPHELFLHVETPPPGSAARDSYGDVCDLNDWLFVTFPEPVVPEPSAQPTQ